MNIQNGFEINEQRGYKLYDIGFFIYFEPTRKKYYRNIMRIGHVLLLNVSKNPISRN